MSDKKLQELVFDELFEDMQELIIKVQNTEKTNENILNLFELKKGEFEISFDNRIEKLNEILKILDSQKEAIVLDVWSKLDSKISKQLNNQMNIESKNSYIDNNFNMIKKYLLIIGVLCVLSILFSIISFF